jgi:hypothetical protein
LTSITAEELVGEEQADWYALTPLERMKPAASAIFFSANDNFSKMFPP